MNKCYLGDCRETLKLIEENSIQCCVTSPPYYGLRDYGHNDQLGLEETPQKYIDNMVEVFREVKRVLRADGTLWLNIGDSYSSHKDCKSIGQTLAKNTSRENAHVMDKGLSRVRDSKMLKSQGLKNKDLIGIPWMLAFALRADGWYLRQDIIWAKPNPMPESVTDRCTKSHEYLFLLTKSSKYYFDNDAIKEPSVSGDGNPPRGSLGVEDSNSGRRNITKFGGDKYGKSDDVTTRTKSGNIYIPTESRNKRSVWTIPTQSCTEAHFAVMPEALVEPCILAGSKVGDIVLDPFMGSGTVAKVAQNLGRKWLGCELNPDYIEIQNKRTSQQALTL